MPTLRLGIDARGARRGSRAYERSTRRVSESSRRVDRNVRALDTSMDRLGGTASQVGRVITGVFATIGGGFGIRGAITTIASFEETLSTLAAVSGANVSTLERLERTARDLGATTRFSATEAAEGLVFLARAGFDADAAIAAIPATLNLAAAGALELGTAADIASNILGQFQLNAGETARVTDVLVRTANSANTDVRQLAEALKLAGPIANAAGLSLEETAAVIGVLGDSGVQASLAGTNLRGVIAALLGPTSQAEEALSSMNITLEDANQIFREGILPVFEQFRDRSLGAAESVTIFGRRNAAASQIITLATDRLNELTIANEQAGGTAERTARIMSDNLTGAFRGLNSAIQEGFLQLGERGLGRALRSVVDRATDVVRVLIGMEDEVTGNAEAARRAADNTLAFGGAIGVLLSFQIAGFFNTAAGAVLRFTAALAANPIALIAVGIATAVGVLIRFRNSLVEVQGESVRVGALVSATFEVIGERARTVFRAIERLFVVFFQAVESIFEQLDTQIGAVIAVIGSNWRSVLDSMISIAREAVNRIIGVFVFLGRSVVNVFSFIRDQIRTTFNALVELISAFGEFEITSPIESSRRILARQATALGILAAGTGQNLTEFIQSQATNALDALTTDFVGRAVEIGGQIAEVVRAGLMEALGPELFSELEQALNLDSALQDIFARALERTQAAAAATSSAVGELSNSTGDLNINLSGSIDGLDGLARGLDTASAASDSLSQMTNKLTDEERRLQEVFENIGQSASDAVEDIIFEFESLTETIRSFLEEISRELFRAFVGSPIRNFFGGLGSTFGLVGSQNGNVFSSGNVVPFQRGGVVEAPSAFQLGDGRIATIAETSPEAILPLSRGSGGRLGVEITNEAVRARPVQVQMTVIARDADSFRQSERQIVGDLRRGLS